MINKPTTAFLVLLLSTNILLAQATIITAANYPVPVPHQLKWHEAELGVVFHYDFHVFDNVKYNQTANRINPVEDYNMFNLTELDTDQWIRAANDAGAKFTVLTATHETGFAIRGKSKLFAAENMVDNNKDTYWATDDDVNNSSFEITLKSPELISYILLQEYIKLGQRVKIFSVEVWGKR